MAWSSLAAELCISAAPHLDQPFVGKLLFRPSIVCSGRYRHMFTFDFVVTYIAEHVSKVCGCWLALSTACLVGIVMLALR